MSQKVNLWPRGEIQRGLPKYCIKITNNKERNNRNLYKTELCDTYEEFGECPYGPRCRYAHGKHELKEKPKIAQPSAYKTVLCKHFWGRNSICPYGNKCKFVHGEANGIDENKANEIRKHKKYKTKDCKTFNKVGSCPFGDKCAYIHKTKTPALKRSISEQENTLIEQKVKDLSVEQLATTMNLQETKTENTVEESRFLNWFYK